MNTNVRANVAKSAKNETRNEKNTILFKKRDAARKMNDQQAEKDAINEIVVYNMPLVGYFLKNNGTSSSKEDMVQEGYLGLMEAARQYSLDAGCSFATYAKYWVLQRAYRYYYNDNAIHLPVNVMQSYLRFTKLLNRNVPIKTIEEVTGMNYSMYKSLGRFMNKNMVKIDAEISSSDGKIYVKDTIPSDETLEEDAVEKEYCETITSAIQGGFVNERNLTIFMKYHGLQNETDDERTLESVAEEYGLTRERVRQINNKVYRKIWVRLRARHLVES